MTRPYAEKMYQVIGHVALANPEYRHPFMQAREVKRVGLIIVSSDRGLCGGLNTNLFRSLVKEIRTLRDEGKEVDYCTIGTKALGFFRRVGGKVVAQATQLGDTPHIDDLVGVILHALDHGEVSGPMNGTAPQPVTNAAFAKALGKVLGRPACLPAPKLALRVVIAFHCPSKR